MLVFFSKARVPALLVTLIAAVTVVQGQLQPNKSEQSNSLDVEQPVLKENHSTTQAPDDAVARLETKLEELKGNTKGLERLCKTGVLSKVEMEQRFLEVIQCEAELANARVAAVKHKVADLQSAIAFDENTKIQLASAKAELRQLAEAAEAATSRRHRAEVEAAEANVRRQQALLKHGVAAKSDVDRAEEKLAELKAQKN